MLNNPMIYALLVVAVVCLLFMAIAKTHRKEGPMRINLFQLWLMGACRHHRSLFYDLFGFSAEVTQETLINAGRYGLHIKWLPQHMGRRKWRQFKAATGLNDRLGFKRGDEVWLKSSHNSKLEIVGFDELSAYCIPLGGKPVCSSYALWELEKVDAKD